MNAVATDFGEFDRKIDWASSAKPAEKGEEAPGDATPGQPTENRPLVEGSILCFAVKLRCASIYPRSNGS